MKYISKLINIYYYKKGMFMKENLALSFYPVSLEQIQEKVTATKSKDVTGNSI